MNKQSKFRVQAGQLLFEIEGAQSFVQGEMKKHHRQIDAILKEQAKIIKSGKAPASGKRRGRPPKSAAKSARGRRPGRQPVIIRDSSLSLKTSQRADLKNALAKAAGDGNLGKDATVFAIAYYLCTKILKSDRFSAGDIMTAHRQLGALAFAPGPRSIDVVQMLRNLAAASIGKVWVARNADGTFSLTAKGKAVGKSGKIVRPRGRRPKAKTAAKAAGAKRGRKKSGKRAAKKKAARHGRPPKKRGPGRPRKVR
jgi:hypothetical protein